MEIYAIHGKMAENMIKYQFNKKHGFGVYFIMKFYNRENIVGKSSFKCLFK